MTLTHAELGPEGFRQALGSFASSVNVITMWGPESQPLGMTATAFSSVSVDPLLVLVCINRDSRTYKHIAATGRFGVNILGSAGRELSDYCARPGGDKVLDASWLHRAGGWHTPALTSALAFLDCAVDQDITAGTHAILIGAVNSVGLNSLADDQEPLVHFRGAYRRLHMLAHYPRPKPLPIVEDWG